MARDSYVYVIGHPSGAKKIGVSIDPELRLQQLNISSPVRLKADYFGRCREDDACAIEMRVHEILSDHRQNGEWFTVPTALAVEAVMNAAQELGCDVVHYDVPTAEPRSRKGSRWYYFDQPCAVAPALFRAARERLGWSESDLARKSETYIEEVQALEAGDRQIRRLYGDRVRSALERAGIDFAEDGQSFQAPDLDREEGLYWIKPCNGGKALALWVDGFWHVVRTETRPHRLPDKRPVVLAGPFLLPRMKP